MDVEGGYVPPIPPEEGYDKTFTIDDGLGTIVFNFTITASQEVMMAGYGSIITSINIWSSDYEAIYDGHTITSSSPYTDLTYYATLSEEILEQIDANADEEFEKIIVQTKTEV